MSDYCTGCAYLGNNKSSDDSWHICKKIIPNLVLIRLYGNPKKLAQCISENWYEKAKPIHIVEPACITCGKPLVETIAAGYVCYKCDEEFNKKQEKTMDIDKMIEVITAWGWNKHIQVQLESKEWVLETRHPQYWNWMLQHRVKPEPKYRPLKPEELITLKGKWLKDRSGYLYAITIITDHSVQVEGSYKDPKQLLMHWFYENGTPCGILE